MVFFIILIFSCVVTFFFWLFDGYETEAAVVCNIDCQCVHQGVSHFRLLEVGRQTLTVSSLSHGLGSWSEEKGESEIITDFSLCFLMVNKT